MLLLNSMTGATPETRLVLLKWASLFGQSVRTGERDVLASALGMSQHHVRVALEYLFREGYLCKIKSAAKASSGRQAANRYDYALATECWVLWCRTIESTIWAEEFLYTLNCVAYEKQIPPDNSKVVADVKGRLVTTALVFLANSAGYVIGCNEQPLSETLGMSVAKLRQTIRELARRNCLSVVAQGVSPSLMFGRLLPIYQIQLKCPRYKYVKLGISSAERQLTPIQFTSGLIDFYRRASKRRNKDRYPSQCSLLPDEHYYELSKIFRNKKLVIFINHLCLSTILSLITEYTHMSRADHYPPDGIKLGSTEKLRELVYLKLTEGLFGDGREVREAVTLRADEQGFYHTGTIPFFTSYTLNELTQELVCEIKMLSKQWKLFTEIYDLGARITGYLPNYLMLATLASTEECQVMESNREPRQIHKEFILPTEYVLTVLVRNDRIIDDCMLVVDELWTAKSELPDPRMRSVERLICLKKSDYSQYSRDKTSVVR